MPSIVRSIGAVAIGFLVIGALAVGTDMLMIEVLAPSLYDARGVTTSLPMLLATQLYVGVYATFGCWLCARLAPDHPMRHALILGALGLTFNAMGSAAKWDTAPLWYHAVGLTTTMAYAWLGGRLRERQLDAAPPAPAPAHW